MWKLAFANRPHLPIFSGRRIEADRCKPLEIVLVNIITGLASALRQPLHLELVPLCGDFPEDWSADDFDRSIVQQRPGKMPLLTGDVNLTMRDGRVSVKELQFTDNSSWIGCGTIRIGVRVVPGSYDGHRIAEAVTEAFVVRQNRRELYLKHYPPFAGDEVWRLEKIARNGSFHRKLMQNGIKTVGDFLTMLRFDPQQLRVVGLNGIILVVPTTILTALSLYFMFWRNRYWTRAHRACGRW